MDILQVENLTFRYPDAVKDALQNISFTVRQGEFTVLCGESGCGKSTLLKLLKRELAPFGEKNGKIFYNGILQDKTDDRQAASEIGFVLQNPESQIVTDKVWHELAFGLESLGYPTQVIRRKTAEMANYFGIENWFHKRTSELSGGQKQMLNLASVMVMKPKILLLDEPTAQLDPIAAANFIGTLQKLNRELGLTVLLAEHRLEEVFPIADRVFLMDNGKLLYADSPRGIGAYFKSNPDHPMVAGLPAAMRIYNELNTNAECPLTVKEGHEFITQNFGNKIRSSKPRKIPYKNEAVLELKDVWFRYEKELPDVLRGISFSVYKGEHFCILGGNGTGKTTTLGVIAGLLRAYRGKVLINGKQTEKLSGKELYRHNIALLPQNPQTVFLKKTVREDFAEICKAMEYKKEDAERLIKEATEKVGIKHLLQTHPYDLSGGEQQKAALAKMLLLQPKILLLDEPTKGIDAHSKLNLAEILRTLKAEEITVITVTHDIEFAAQNADRCAFFFDGELVSVDTPAAFFADNNFYTTAANRIAGDYYDNAVLCEDVVALCKANGIKKRDIE